MNRIYLSIHMGLGDAIICNGIVTTLVKQGNHVTIPAFTRNLVSVTHMFSPLIAAGKVSVVECPMTGATIAPPPVDETIVLGYLGKQFNDQVFDISFYRQAKVDFTHRWLSFTMPDITYSAYPPSPEVFVHDDELRGYKINVEGYRPRKTNSILDHIPDLMRAKEIHCISSSFALLRDSLPKVEGQKLFLHAYARPGEALPSFILPWETIKTPV